MRYAAPMYVVNQGPAYTHRSSAKPSRRPPTIRLSAIADAPAATAAGIGSRGYRGYGIAAGAIVGFGHRRLCTATVYRLAPSLSACGAPLGMRHLMAPRHRRGMRYRPRHRMESRRGRTHWWNARVHHDARCAASHGRAVSVSCIPRRSASASGAASKKQPLIGLIFLETCIRRASARRLRFRCAQHRRRRVERDRRRIRHVQALDRAGQIEPRADIAGLRGELAQAFALGAEHQRERLAQRALAKSVSPSLSSPTVRKPRSFSSVSARARFGTVTIGMRSSAPDADFASTPVASGECRAVVTTAFTANAAASAGSRRRYADR